MQMEGRKKVAVVLSGGGAKGAAHVGALKVIEEAGIPVDMVVGTSMGSIIGGLYAIGYTPAQMDSIISSQDWTALLTDMSDRKQELLSDKQRSEQYVLSLPFKKRPKDALKGGLVQGYNIGELFSELTMGYHDSIDFNRLPIPFACVAHNLADGTEYVFHSGKLGLAMRASMSIPGVYQPVRYQGMVLVDGGLSNNYPVDVARQMGADIVIGVDVQEGLAPADKLNTLMEVLGQIVNLMVDNKYKENVDNSDVHIKVYADDYSAASFSSSAIETLLHRGEIAAHEHWEDLKRVKEEIGFTAYEEVERPTPHALTTDQPYDRIPEITASKDKRMNTVSVGVRFDNESLAALKFNTNLFLNEKKNQEVGLTVRLGRKMLGRLDYRVRPFGTPWSVNTAYQIDYNDLDLYNRGKKICTYSFLHNLLQFNLARSWRSINFSIGARYENFHFDDFLLPLGYTGIEEVQNEDFIVYYGQMQFDSFNRRTFPTSGIKWEIRGYVYTDDLISYREERPMPILSAYWEGAFRLRNRLTLLPGLYGRYILAKDNNYTLPVINVVGGSTPQRFLPQQMPFVGVNYMQIAYAKASVASLKLRQRMGSNQYLSLTGNVLFSAEEWRDMMSQNRWGVGVSYGYDSFIGPLEVTAHYSNATDKLGFFINLGYNF
jgi:NTE family protein